MADHRAETIMAAVLTTLTNLATTGENVARGRYYAWPEATANAIEISQGSDEPLEGEARNIAFTDSWLTVNTDIITKYNADHETRLNQIRAEVTVAMMADYTQGLAFVLDTVEGPAEPYEIEQSDQATARQRLTWRIKYRRSVTDPTTS